MSHGLNFLSQVYIDIGANSAFRVLKGKKKLSQVEEMGQLRKGVQTICWKVGESLNEMHVFAGK